MGAPTRTSTAARRPTAAEPQEARKKEAETDVGTAPVAEPAAAAAGGTPAAAPTRSAGRAHRGKASESAQRRGWPRVPRHPSIWFESVLVALGYWTYSLVRNAVPEQRSIALTNADWVWRTEHALGIAVESSINRAAEGVTWLIVTMNYYYATLHFVLTVAVLVWLYRAHPGRYAATRLVLLATTCVALVGYYLFPLAPPRLMRGGHFVDTVQVHHTWGSMASGNLADMSNQYAAMPSMHIGWSVWCGVTVVMLAKPLWARVLGGLYPLTTLTVIVCTANHFWLDAVGGLLCLCFGFCCSLVWYGRVAYRLPQLAGAPAT
jgi:hypothetical protein